MLWLLFAVLIAAAVIALQLGRKKPAPDPELLAQAEARIRETLARKASMARPTLLLRADGASGVSHIGGAPNLPLGCEWPVGHGGPMGFLWQLDLAEVRLAGGPDWLPDTGLLCLFHNDDYGRANQCRVLFVEAQGAAATPPLNLPKAWRYPEHGVSLESFTSVPSMEWLEVDAGQGADWDKLIDDDAQTFGEGPQHRIGGYPYEIQNEALWLSCEYAARGLDPDKQGRPPEAEVVAAAQSWRLLFQVDSDAGLGTNWGDGGMLYVFIREEDARAGEFSKTVTLSQTY